MRPEDDLVGVPVPQAAHTALGRRGGEGLEISERQAERRLVLGEHVGTELVALRVKTGRHRLARPFAKRAAVHAEGRRMPALPAPAKINLTLEVLARREDGYHTLRSVMVPIGLYDRIELEAAEAGARGSFTVEGDAPDGAAEDNLVLRALEAAGVKTPMRVTLEKRVPIGGGLGGGSSDAAAVLRAAVEGRLGPAGVGAWLGAARGLGSDVSFFMVGTAALV